MLSAVQRWWQRRGQALAQARIANVVMRRSVSHPLWQQTLAELAFLTHLSAPELERLRRMVSLFLDDKEFSALDEQGRAARVTDAQAVMVAAQACLAVLHIAPPDRPDLALAWYDGFVGIVLQPSAVRARREWMDEDGIAHTGSEELTGEILEGGPLMLAWSDVAAAGELAKQAYNVVIHEFVHVMDVRDGAADGCPPMRNNERQHWLATMQAAYEKFCEESEAWERFGGMAADLRAPLLDAYGCTSIDEFFAVAAEGYFVQRQAFAQQYPQLLELFDGFFRSGEETISHQA
jgi:MtfA peptidase